MTCNKAMKSISLTVGLVLSLATSGVPALAQGAPHLAAAPRVLADITPGGACTPDGVANAVTCHLYAKTATLTVPSGTVAVRGYSSEADGTAQVPGPAIVVDEGDTVTITLHNDLGEATALSLPQMEMIPDRVGIVSGTTDYTFAAGRAGTYLYEAGGPDGPRQVASGMAGAIVVEPIDGIALADRSEHLVVLSEIDLNLGSDLRRFSPRYLLVNGQVASPGVSTLPVTAGSTVRLRYVNAGLRHHSLGLLGLDQRFTAMDGFGLAAGGYSVVSEALAPGQTAEALVSIPAGLPPGTRFPIYDGSFLGGTGGFGGMLTYLEVVDGTPTTPGGGVPVSTGVTVVPVVSSDGTVDVSATVVDPDGVGVTEAEIFLDATGPDATGTPGTFDSLSSTWTWSLSGLTSGRHTVFVHGADLADGWGAFASAGFRVDVDGPLVSGLSAWPNPSSGQVAVSIAATANDTTTGGSTIAAAEYRINGVGASMMITPPSATSASLDALIPATTMQSLAAGGHTLEIRAQDAVGHWSEWSPITLTLIVDTTGPTTSELLIRPSITDGTQGYNPSIPSVRVDARFVDTTSNIAGAEGFIDSVGVDGSGFPLTPKDGLFNSLDEYGFAYVPLTTVVQLPDGVHQIHVHGKDASGNWGSTVAGPLFVDKLAPTVGSGLAVPDPTGGADTLVLTAIGTDTVTNISAGEWYEGADPGVGNGRPMAAIDGAFDSTTEAVTANVALNCFAVGIHTLNVRVKDSNNHWSDPLAISFVVDVQPNAIFSDGFESGNLGMWDATTGSVSVTTGSALAGSYGMAVSLSGNNPRFVTNNCPADETSYRVSFLFNPNGAVTGNNLGTGYAIFSGLDGAGTSVVRVQYRRQNTGGGTYQIRLAVNRAGGVSATGWQTITNAAHLIEMRWASGTSTTASIKLDAGAAVILGGLDTSAIRVETARLGPSAGLTNQASGTMYFDEFTSWRSNP